MTVAFGLLIPLFGTALGAAAVFLFRGKMSGSLQKAFLGFASGVMIAASVWSLLIPAIEQTREASPNIPAWLPAAIGFLLGIAFLLTLDNAVPHLHLGSDSPEGRKSALGKSTMLILAVTLHNIPEGMAVGVVFAGAIAGNTGVTLAAAFALCIGIALQNIPEGAVVSTPLIGEGFTRRRAFLYGSASGAVEPVAAAVTIAVTAFITPVLPYILSFAAGAMIYVVIEELIPDAQEGEHSNIGTIAAAFGFVLMMVLDVALG
ncbi:MAG: ZIP family metal transporter [Oscillospiraceae bacterium]|jgi:ZIP family zinc transporter|nr:ZIP family metal transporter [Oscillospiraceae bacterium]